jgi:hypothetical protein
VQRGEHSGAAGAEDEDFAGKIVDGEHNAAPNEIEESQAIGLICHGFYAVHRRLNHGLRIPMARFST